MSLTSRAFFSASAAVLALSSVSPLAASAQAASISYPNQGPIPPGYTFTNIVESSGTDGVPLYGPPTRVSHWAGLHADRLHRFERRRRRRPDRRPAQLHGHGRAERAGHSVDQPCRKAARSRWPAPARRPRRCCAGAIIRATVLEINGVAVAPINLAPVNGSVASTLIANPGVAQPWGLGADAQRGRATRGPGLWPASSGHEGRCRHQQCAGRRQRRRPVQQHGDHHQGRLRREHHARAGLAAC